MLAEVFFILVLGLHVLALGNGYSGKSKIEFFLGQVKTISTDADLRQFKKMVRTQMYLALVQLVLQGGATLLMVWGILAGYLGLLEILVLLCLNGVIIYVAIKFKAVEKAACQLPVTEESFRGEYETVCHAWKKKPLPDF